MKKNLVLLFSLILFCCSTYAQQKTFSGIVKDSKSNEALAGVSVTIKGTTTGVMTDIDGKYTIQAAANQTLVFSFLGMNYTFGIERSLRSKRCLDGRCSGGRIWRD